MVSRIGVGIVGTAGIMLWTLAGCGAPGAPLARVNGHAVTLAMVRTREAMAEVLRPSSRPERRQTLQQVVDETLVIEWARQNHVPHPSTKAVNGAIMALQARAGGAGALSRRLARAHETRAALRRFVTQELVIDAVFQEKAADVPGPTAAAVSRYYQAHRASFTTPKTVLAREIVAGSEADARSLVDRIRHGSSFSALAARQSTSRSTAPRGGSLGWVPLMSNNGMPAPVEHLLAREAPGRMGIAHTRFGYSIVEVQADKPGRPIPLSNVAGLIRKAVRTRRENAVFQQFVKHLRSRAHLAAGGP